MDNLGLDDHLMNGYLTRQKVMSNGLIRAMLIPLSRPNLSRNDHNPVLKKHSEINYICSKCS